MPFQPGCHPPQAGDALPAGQVDLGGTVYQGRLTRADSDPEYRKAPALALRHPRPGGLGLTRTPETILQIANIPDDGIHPLENS